MARSKAGKGAFRFLAECQDPRVGSTILGRDSDKLVKTICIAAQNKRVRGLNVKEKAENRVKKTSQAYSHVNKQNFHNRTKPKVFETKGRLFPRHPNPPVNCAVGTRLSTLQQMRKMTLVEEAVLERLRLTISLSICTVPTVI